MPRILGVSGSLRRDSWNRRLLRAAAELLPGDVDWVELEGLRELPAFDQDEEKVPPDAVVSFKDAIAAADGILFATPEYNSSVPGALKNALDWASRPLATSPLRNLPVAVVGASTGAFGAVWAQAELRKVLAATGARVVEGEVALGHAPERFDDVGRLADEALREQLAEVVSGLVAEIRVREGLAA